MNIQGSSFFSQAGVAGRSGVAGSSNKKSGIDSSVNVNSFDGVLEEVQNKKASSGKDLPLEEYQLPKWYCEFSPPCLIYDQKIGEKINMKKYNFMQKHKREISEYSGMLHEALSHVYDKYGITKFSDFAKYSEAEVEAEFRKVLSQNEGVEKLMETLNVSERF
ncbi:MAG TPA: hypothetical protein DCS48_09110 [Desulfovibrio sp.]|nr:hypothetical protein [Desulfovibrio sp.]